MTTTLYLAKDHARDAEMGDTIPHMLPLSRRRRALADLRGSHSDLRTGATHWCFASRASCDRAREWCVRWSSQCGRSHTGII